MKWTEPGDRLIGTVVGKARGKSMDGDPVPELTVSDEDGVELVVTAAQAHLKGALLDNPPELGDEIDICFVRLDNRNGKTMKQFTVELTRDGTPVV